MSVVRLCVKFEYGYQNNVTEKQHEKLKKIFIKMKEYKEYEYGGADIEIIADVEDIDMIDEDIESIVQIKPVRKLRFAQFEKEIPDLNDSISKEEIKDVVNQTFQIHLPNSDLLQFKSVDYMDNACTESLRDRVNDGWSILAICPQVGQRRPDYILGHRDRGETL